MIRRPPNVTRPIDEYTALFEAFVSGEVDGETFEQRYYPLFSNDPTIRPEPIFLALDDVFHAADWFYADPDLREEGDLDEEQFRERVRATLRVLADLKAPV